MLSAVSSKWIMLVVVARGGEIGEREDRLSEKLRKRMQIRVRVQPSFITCTKGSLILVPLGLLLIFQLDSELLCLQSLMKTQGRSCIGFRPFSDNLLLLLL